MVLIPVNLLLKVKWKNKLMDFGKNSKNLTKLLLKDLLPLLCYLKIKLKNFNKNKNLLYLCLNLELLNTGNLLGIYIKLLLDKNKIEKIYIFITFIFFIKIYIIYKILNILLEIFLFINIILYFFFIILIIMILHYLYSDLNAYY